MYSAVYNRNAGWQHCFVRFFCCCCCLACCCCYPLASRDPTLDTFYSPSCNVCPCAHIPTPFWNLCPFLKRITDKCNDYRVAHTIQPLESETVLLLLHWTLPNDIGGPSFLISICQQTNAKDIAGQSARNHIAIEYSGVPSSGGQFKNATQAIKLFVCLFFFFILMPRILMVPA